jgi:hypothetical protein
MKLLIIQLGNISNRRIDARKQVLLSDVIEDVRLQYREINTVQKLEVGNVLYR